MISQPDTDSSTCEHPSAARGYWTRYVSGTAWDFGYVCGDCGEEKTTGLVQGKPHFGRCPS
jgi:hypothetical protein